jgi:hypothetical protein
VSNRYRVLLPLVVHTEDGSYEQGEEFEKEFTPEDERENVESGLLAIVPNRFKVVGPSNVDGTDPGGEFESDMTLAREALLVAGGHIERVVKPVKESRKKEAKT